ncbi:DUF732 domain-containing protein [Mycobacterium shigaense]|uniref:Uncharacterized protein n=1 Tax=Mycobacterium shigaense TaxID=722731 RepID=A0A1Z4EGD4_9MYCO|nr:DUF732 domain-containing protein [Mycobacterium shigaense]MEA1123871.1 DUF732 domain-containing protein [Mycobacterium shigaense]PRI16719.1 hypothetical protein B2J96_03425 [Mycobacterium shigaense]BAX92021.1 hypothetical protein MSG_01868 [Mycobacterium shigaense]
MKSVLASVAAISAVMCAAPRVAHADSTSDYLNTINSHHISYANQDKIVQIGTTLCQELRNSLPGDEALKRIQNLGYTSGQANVIAAAAVLAFCPDMDNDPL